MKRSILLLGATLVFVLAGTIQLVLAQEEVKIKVSHQGGPEGPQIDVSVRPWIANIPRDGDCTWEVTMGAHISAIEFFWVRGFTRPLPNLDEDSSTVLVRKRGPFKLHPKCEADVDCNGDNSTNVDPPLERYDIIIDVVLDSGEETRVLVDPGHRVRP